MKNFKSFTLMEILLGALIFVVVGIMATATITSAVNTRNKTKQQRTINMAAQRIFDEIGRTIRDGNPKKQIYICSHDSQGQLVPPYKIWGSVNEPPNDFVKDAVGAGFNENTIRYNINNPAFGEQLGERRMGNILQIVAGKELFVESIEVE